MAASIVNRMERGVRESRSHVVRAKSGDRKAGADLAPQTAAVLLVAPVVATALFYVWTHVAAVRLGYEMSEAGDQHRALLEENRALRIEAAALKAPERLQQIARAHHLAPPKGQQIIRVAKEPR